MREIAILALLFVIPLAYAEEFTEDQCEEYENIAVEGVRCEKETPKEFNVTAIQEGLDELEKAVLEGIDILKKSGEYVRPPEQDWRTGEPIKDKNPDSILDNLVESACESDRPSDMELCSHLNQLSKCEQGVRETESEPVSTYRSFTVSEGQPNPVQNYDLQDNSFLRDIYKKIEECYAIWQVLQPTVLGEQYLNFIRQSDDLQPYHADINPREAIRSDKIVEGTFERTQTEAQKIICYSDRYGKATKLTYGCPDDLQGDVKNPSKVIHKTADPYEAYQQYLNNPTGYRLDAKGNFVIITGMHQEVGTGNWTLEAKR